MAKCSAPLQSFSAHGTLAKNLTFSLRQSGQQVRWQKKQKDVITSARTTQRNKFLVAKTMWPLYGFGSMQFGYNLVGSHFVSISSLPLHQRAPQFALFVSAVLKYYK
jgi:hypothetical protein